jgi:hypothetical protein
LKDALRSSRDEAVEAIRQKYAGRQAALGEKLRKAQAAVGREEEQASQQKIQTALSVGATVLATTAARGVGRSMKEAGDVKRASASVEAVQQQMQDLEAAVRDETQAIASRFDAEPTFDRVTLVPKRGQVTIQFVGLGWDPR